MDIVSLFWKSKAQRHEELKERLHELKSKRNFLIILNKPNTKYDREIKRLENRLSKCHINIQ